MKKADQDVTLRYGTLENNFEEYKSWMSTAACREFGDLGRMIDLGGYYDPEPVPAPPAGAGQVEVGVYIEERKLRARRVAKMHGDRTALYAFIRMTLSPESTAQVELAEDWAEISAQKDPLRLWQRIEATHVGAGTVKHGLVLRDLRAQFRLLAQGPKEDLTTFKRRYEDLSTRLRAVGDPELEQKSRAIELVGMLDDARYGALKLELENSVYTGTSKYPETVAGVFALAAQYRAPQRAVQGTGVAAHPSSSVNSHH
jgi:hypothetical protein